MFNKNKKIVLSDELKKKIVIGAKKAFGETKKEADLTKDIFDLAEKNDIINEEIIKYKKSINDKVEELKIFTDWIIQELGDYDK